MREHNIQNIAHLSYYTNANGLLLVVLIKRGSAKISLAFVSGSGALDWTMRPGVSFVRALLEGWKPAGGVDPSPRQHVSRGVIQQRR